jgi:dienelactone hydrolase
MHYVFALLALAVASCAAAQDELTRIPVVDAGGQTRQLVTRVCLPSGSAPAQVVVINHGSPGSEAERSVMRPASCEHQAVRWFTGRGRAVVLPMRRGYGETGGVWAEAYGPCASPDFFRAGREAARDIAASVAWAVRQPWARPDGVVVVGQSAGGWGAMALAGVAPPQVSAIVNMAGGRAGRQGGVANRNCAPERLAEAAGRFAEGASVRMLWVYTANDSFFAPEIPAAMHASFTRAGGRAELRQLPAWGNDGHALFFGRDGSATWGPVLAPFLGLRG